MDRSILSESSRRQMIAFNIDGQVFSCPQKSLNALSFSVQSVPCPYTLTWHVTEEAPLWRINHQLAQNAHHVLLIDAHVWDLYGSVFSIASERIFKVHAAENFKTLDKVTEVLSFLCRQEVSKGDALFVVGGGITQDLGAFVSAIYKRGIPWYYFPTTLLSMADSCLGGKAGLNFQDAKNQVALFSTPHTVTLCPTFLQTLPEAAIISGLGEILKACIIGGSDFLALYQSHVNQGQVSSEAAFQNLIMAALWVKKTIVEYDEFETNHRRSLNYGHTLGHALEVLSHYQIPHGQSVVIGMAIANELSHQQGLLSAADLKKLNQLCYDLISDTVMDHLAQIRVVDCLALLQKDKKTLGQVTYFVLMKAPGETCFVKLARDAVLMQAVDAAWQRVLQRA